MSSVTPTGSLSKSREDLMKVKTEGLLQVAKQCIRNKKARLDFTPQKKKNPGQFFYKEDNIEATSSVERACMCLGLSAQNQSNSAKLTGQCFTVQMDNDPKHTTKATKQFSRQRN